VKKAKLDPLKPSRADYRLIHRILESTFSGKVIHTNEGYEIVVAVYQRAGGSWEKLFMGSSNDLGLLKTVLKVAVKKEIIPKAPEWR
jgi:hypothetical protein